ncbi:hypothetical protein WJ438_00580 [Streptomyces sp. GD-15H]|uniref:hypothetical protein n=1 Tax=Streptomyces sp. GD-15H TaxID=3129112 RepID=UPI00324EFAAE
MPQPPRRRCFPAGPPQPPRLPWVATKLRWNLAADSAELATLDDLAGACPEQAVTYEPAG